MITEEVLRLSNDGSFPNRAAHREELTQRAIEKYDDDQLELKAHARAFARTLTSMKGGAVVAVLGDWGQGKTSFLNMVSDYLGSNPDGEDPPVKTVSIPLWKYEKVSDVVYAIARDTQEQTLSTGGRVWRAFRAYGEHSLVGFSTVLRSLKISPPWLPVEFSAADKPEQIQARAKEIDRRHFRYLEDIEQCVRFFDNCTAPESEEVIVFIDDVDRVEPEAALNLLENLKMLLGNAKCRFVLALDHGVLRQAVTARYKKREYEDPGQCALHYLDKLIDLAVSLPRLSITDAERFLDELRQKFPEHASLTPAERAVLLAGAPLNPRAIKRLLAALYHEKQVLRACKEGASPDSSDTHAASSGSHVDGQALKQARRMKRILLQTFYPAVVAWALAYPEKFFAMQRDSGPDEPEWPPTPELTSKARAASPDLHEMALQTLDGESEKPLVTWVTKSCPHLWGFLRYTPAIKAIDFSHVSHAAGRS